MAGPGGGARGGGFSGGGGRSGGGFGGGGFRGGHHGGFGGHHHHHHHGGFWFFGRRRYYGYGGGCLGGLAGLILAPVIMIVLAVVLFSVSVGSAFSSIANGGSVIYDEVKFQDYANDAYYSEFGSYDGVEDNLLIVFLVDENSESYTCIAWLGDNIKTSVNDMFGAEGTEFYYAVTSSVNESNYKYSLSQNLAAVMEKMTAEVEELGLATPFKNPEAKTSVATPHINNKSTLTINENTVNTSLADFTAKTSIPAVITVDSMENVFGKTIMTGDLIFVILSVGLLALAIFLIVKNIREAKRERLDNDGTKTRDNIFDDKDFR